MSPSQYFNQYYRSLLIAVSLCLPSLTQALVQKQTACSLPEIHLSQLDGKQYPLNLYHGNVVILAFWTTWCFTCRTKELPGLLALQQSLESPGLSILLISNDAGKYQVRRYLNHASVDLGELEQTIYFDPDYETYRAIIGRNSIPVHPRAVVFDRRGCVVSQMAGSYDWQSETAVNFIKALVYESGNTDQ